MLLFSRFPHPVTISAASSFGLASGCEALSSRNDQILISAAKCVISFSLLFFSGLHLYRRDTAFPELGHNSRHFNGKFWGTYTYVLEIPATNYTKCQQYNYKQFRVKKWASGLCWLRFGPKAESRWLREAKRRESFLWCLSVKRQTNENRLPAQWGYWAAASFVIRSQTEVGM